MDRPALHFFDVPERWFSQVVISFVVLGFLGLMIGGVAAGWIVSLNQDRTAWITHTYQIERLIRNYRRQFAVLQADRSGFLIDGETRFKTEFQTNQTDVYEALAQLRNQTADEPNQQPRISRLYTLTAREISTLSVSMADAGAGQQDAAQRAFTADSNSRLEQEVDQVSRDMLREENALLAGRERDRTAAEGHFYLLLGVLGVLLVTVGASSVMVILRRTEQLTTSRNSLQALADNLEDMVEARTRELQQANDKIQLSNERLQAMLHEVNHRVANSLQLVIALVRMQASSITDAPAKAALADTQQRIAAIAQVHRRLYSGQDVEHVEMADYLVPLAAELEQAWTDPASPRRVRVTAEPLTLNTDRAVSVGIIVNELVANACKYAYPFGQAGEVRVTLSADGKRRFKLTVEDDGGGMPADPKPQGTGLGGRLLDAMTKTLEGSLKIDSSAVGVKATLNAPRSQQKGRPEGRPLKPHEDPTPA